MSFFLFTKAILEGNPIQVFNEGNMLRDFTYVEDVVKGISLIMQKPPVYKTYFGEEKIKTSSSTAPYKIYNIGNNNPVKLMDFIDAIENSLGKKAEKILLPMQAGDVPATFADVSDFVEKTGYKPSTSINEGIEKFVKWYKEYYK